MTPHEQLSERILSLQSAILSKHPTMPSLLQEIWKALKAQPENVTLMSEEEIAIVVQGLQAQTGVSLAASVSKSAKSPTASAAVKNKIAQLGLDAF